MSEQSHQLHRIVLLREFFLVPMIFDFLFFSLTFSIELLSPSFEDILGLQTTLSLIMFIHSQYTITVKCKADHPNLCSIKQRKRRCEQKRSKRPAGNGSSTDPAPAKQNRNENDGTSCTQKRCWAERRTVRDQWECYKRIAVLLKTQLFNHLLKISSTVQDNSVLRLYQISW